MVLVHGGRIAVTSEPHVGTQLSCEHSFTTSGSLGHSATFGNHHLLVRRHLAILAADLFDGLDDVHPLDNLAKDDVLATDALAHRLGVRDSLEPLALLSDSDEELAAVGIGTGVGRGEEAGLCDVSVDSV